MENMKCPTCGCQSFYVKDPDDEFSIYVFKCEDGDLCFDPEISKDALPQIDDNTETFCNDCSWHDSFKKVKIDFK